MHFHDTYTRSRFTRGTRITRKANRTLDKQRTRHGLCHLLIRDTVNSNNKVRYMVWSFQKMLKRTHLWNGLYHILNLLLSFLSPSLPSKNRFTYWVTLWSIITRRSFNTRRSSCPWWPSLTLLTPFSFWTLSRIGMISITLCKIQSYKL